MVQSSEKIKKNILGPNFFDPKLSQPKLFQAKCTLSLHIIWAFANSFSLQVEKNDISLYIDIYQFEFDIDTFNKDMSMVLVVAKFLG